MSDLLAHAADRFPERSALEWIDGALTYSELEQLVRRVTGALVARGVEEGDRVGMWSPPGPMWAALLWALPRLGAALVPLDRAWPPAWAAATAKAAGIGLLVHDGSAPIDVPDMAVGDLVRGAPRAGSQPDLATVHLVVFTSGTGGTPRGVVLTGANLMAAAAASRDRIGYDGSDRWLTVMPLSHIGGISILWRCVEAGATAVVEPRFDAEAVAASFRGRVTVASLVPTMVRRVLAAGGRGAGLRAVLVGGAPAPPALLAEARKAGIPVLATYGMTEMASQVATQPPGASGVAAPPLPGVEVAVVGEHGTRLGPGEPGVIEVRGPMLSPGYVGEAPRQPGDWLRTSDIGVLDGGGWLTVVGRSDDTIVTGGEKVHPAVVEAAIAAHPGVADCAVFGMADLEWGEMVVAAVVVRPGHRVTTAELSDFVRERLAPHQAPKRFEILAELPRTGLGKLDRAALRK